MSGHLIHIGWAKAGSTLLQRWFEMHPQLAYRNGGLAGFGSVLDLMHAGIAAERPPWRVTSVEGFSAPRIGAERGPVDYSDTGRSMAESQDSACRHLKTLFPDASILIVTRGFRAMILSSYSQYARSGGDRDLEALIAEPRGQSNEVWNYGRVIGLYRNAFGPGRVLVLPYELLRDDPGRFFGRIENWLGIATCDPPTDRLNESLSPLEMRWYPRLARAVGALPVGQKLRARLLDLYVHMALRNRLAPLIRLLQRLAPMPPLTPDLLPDAAVEACRGYADTLRDAPDHAAYAAHYLF